MTKECLVCKKLLVRKYREGFQHFEDKKFCSLVCKNKYIWTGRKHTMETRIKMSLAGKPNNRNEKNHNWKGNNVSYRSLHTWVERNLGKANKCMNNILHKSTRYHWANISHEYKRDLSDWTQLCPSCNGRDRIGRRVSP